MPAPRKYPPELIERGVRMVRELRRDAPGRSGTVRQVGEVLHIHPEVLRHWVKKADAEADEHRDPTKAENLHLHRLEQENRELRRVNGILKAAALLFAAELGEGKDPSTN
ncbi:transposase [Streptomyces coelicoflavus]|uniref:transposase n=1 Tax=Streptomyces coelicoflavus TaxID=285562 RepID=UPI002E269854|nr:transposase [Streptomyces coelicoflavus]